MIRHLKDIHSAALGTGAPGPGKFLEGSRGWTTLAATSSGIFTPTLTNVANLEGSTAYTAQWSRVGNVVTVSGKVDIDPDLPATQTKLGISLPVASNLANEQECGGVAFSSTIAGQGAGIFGDATNNRAEMRWISGDVGSQPMNFIFQYQII